MDKIIVAGIGTDVGKTVVSAILTTLLGGDYWKPAECGDENFDSEAMKALVDQKRHRIFDSPYALKAPLSPHHASHLEGIEIAESALIPPITNRPLIIESAGGVLVPLSEKLLSIDLFKSWGAEWIVVSKNYLGSINHTLMTIEVLKARGVSILGLIFNGVSYPEGEEVILKHAKVPCLARLYPEKRIDKHTIKRYAELWQNNF